MKKVKDWEVYKRAVLPVHFARAVKAGVKWGMPGKKMRVIGVTGTNGKTTTCFMIWKMLNEAGHKTGVMTTVGWGVEKIEKQRAHMTTESSEILNERMAKIAEMGAEFLVLEVTSHALVQFRTWGVPIEIAVMTNVTHDHLDYHGTFERYVKAKCKLFKGAQYGVVNADDGSAREFLQALGDKEYALYGIKNGNLRVFEIKSGDFGVEYAYGDINNEKRDGSKKAKEKTKVKLRLAGKFNVYNSLAAVCVGRKLGLSEKEIVRGLGALTEVEGRMNRVEAGQDFTVIVDYAHTPDAFLKVFEAVGGEEKEAKGEKTQPETKKNKKPQKSAKRRKVITITGGAGRRDETTREERGEIAGKNSDVFIVTEDDYRDEDPEEIAEMFVAGAVKVGMKRIKKEELKSKAKGDNLVEVIKKYEKVVVVENDRRKAIELGLRWAKKGDLVLVLGKGHEKTILRGEKAEPFEDLKVVREELEKNVKK